MGAVSPSPLLFATVVIVLAVNTFAALAIGNGVKRMMGLLMAHIAASVLIVLLGAPALTGLAALTLAAGVSAAALAAALTARIEEAFGGAETHTLNAAEERADFGGAAQ